jgi:hypothetical protein
MQLMFGYIEALLTVKLLRICNVIYKLEMNLITLIGLVTPQRSFEYYDHDKSR